MPPAARTSVWTEAAEAFSRWREGDPGGLDDLVRTLTPVLWHVVRSYRLDDHRAEDVVQTTWMTLVRRRDTIDDPRAVGAWLTTTARREAWRVASRAGRDVPVEDVVLQRDTVSAPGADDAVVAADESARLWATVQQLSERCQRLLRVIAFSERPDYRALADDLGMPVGSIGPTRGRCLAKLRALIAAGSVAGEPA